MFLDGGCVRTLFEYKKKQTKANKMFHDLRHRVKFYAFTVKYNRTKDR